jgi:hypothetical protein
MVFEEAYRAAETRRIMRVGRFGIILSGLCPTETARFGVTAIMEYLEAYRSQTLSNTKGKVSAGAAC